MTLHSDGIHEAMKRPDLQDRLIISPILEPATQIGPGSVDLRLGTEFLELNRAGEHLLDPFREGSTPFEHGLAERRTVVPFGEGIALHPSQFVLGCTLEFLSVPRDISGQVVSRSSWGRLGLLVATAVTVQPGYKGVLTLELVNTGAVPIFLRPGTRIAQLQLWRADQPTSTPYEGRYRVPTGPESARFGRERAEGATLAHIGQRLAQYRAPATEAVGTAHG